MALWKYAALLVASCLLLLARPTLAQAPTADPSAARELDCAALDCASVLPGAARFERVEGSGGAAPFRVGYDAQGDIVGWVALSTDVVDIKAYSGKPLVTLVGLTPDGVIAGARVVHHSEPILLVGIPERALTEFVDSYRGRSASEKVVVGHSTEPDAVTVDVISGATVTALAQNRTVLETARALGVAVGVIEAAASVPGHFVQRDDVWTWQQLVAERALGHLKVSQADMGSQGDEPFIELYFAIADAPHVGKALLGEEQYAWQMQRLEAGQHLLVVLGRGTSSFKGSGFVRGGIFDRVRVEQGLRSILFRDTDYENLARTPAEGAPEFAEGALFVTPKGQLDPGRTFDLVFLGSRYNKKGGFSRDFNAFRGSLRVPKSVYVLDGPDPEQAIWRQAWVNNRVKVVGLGAYLLVIAGLFVGRRWLTGTMRRLQRLHTLALVTSFAFLGLYLHAQPSVTQLLTLVGSIIDEMRWGLFLSEPLLFVSWIFIAAVTLIWGRGVFCGWVCPYGAMSELLFRVGRLLKLPELELPEWLHLRARYVRYGVLALLVGTFLYSSELGERLAEIEPFKSTFFVAPWTRELLFFGWWLALAAASLVTFRPFCRYLCPLGAALALPSSLRLSGPHRRNFCSSCTICTRGCEPKAIRSDGTIDRRECLSCMECEANYRDHEVCPPLVGIDRLLQKQRRHGTLNEERLRKLEVDAQKVPHRWVD